MKNRYKNFILKITLDTPLVSLGLIIGVFVIAWIISSNAYVYDYMSVNAHLEKNNEQKATISVSIDADIVFEGDLKTATWSYQDDDIVHSCTYEFDTVTKGMREIKYSTDSISDISEDSSIENVNMEIATQKLTLAQYIVRSFTSYGD